MATVVSAMPFKPSRSGSWFSLQGKKYSVVTGRTRVFPDAASIISYMRDVFLHSRYLAQGETLTHTLETDYLKLNTGIAELH